MTLAGDGCSDTIDAGDDGVLLIAGFVAEVLGGAMLTVPNLKPASCSVRVALPNGCPTKFGITNAGASGASDTRRLVLGAATWLALAGGLCANTWSAAVPGS